MENSAGDLSVFLRFLKWYNCQKHGMILHGQNFVRQTRINFGSFYALPAMRFGVDGRERNMLDRVDYACNPRWSMVRSRCSQLG